MYQAEGNLEQAAKLLSEITVQTPFEFVFVIKITQLRLERNYAEAVRLLQARQAQFHFASEIEKGINQVLLALLQHLAATLLAQKLPLNRPATRSSRSTKINKTTLCSRQIYP